jgi:hypothetical protein
MMFMGVGQLTPLEVQNMIVSSGTVYKWASMLDKHQDSDKFSQVMRTFGLEILQTLEQSPSVIVEVPYKISSTSSDEEVVQWLQKIRITVPEER